jgi:monofunctional chorismate mutase
MRHHDTEEHDMNATVRDDPSTATQEAQEDPVEAKRLADERIGGMRTRIDEIDATIIQLWLERAAISQEVGATRMAAGGTRLVLAREQEILARFRDAIGPDGTQLAMLILRAGRGPLV